MLQYLQPYQEKYRYRSGSDGPIVEVSVSYEMGGTNFMSGNTTRRGVWVHVTPMTISDGFSSIVITGRMETQGFKQLGVELKRKNENQKIKVAVQIDPLVPEIAQLFLEKRYSECAAKLSAALESLKKAA